MKYFATIIVLTFTLMFYGRFGPVTTSAQKGNSEELIAKFEETIVQDTSKVLDEKDREEIVRQFTHAYITITRQNYSDYISPKARIYVLLKNNFPGVKEREEERGISLGNIVRFLNSSAENKRIINSVLITQKKQKCS